tara:strand:- start:800 stop:1090 length:291 start_codon:yes stop_codon:yes gene_type:complete
LTLIFNLHILDIYGFRRREAWAMAWDKSKGFLEKVQLSSIVLYLICLGGYTIDAVERVYDQIRADIFGFTFFCLFIASTILLRFEAGDEADSDGGQ